jgi:hypothetical protein
MTCLTISLLSVTLNLTSVTYSMEKLHVKYALYIQRSKTIANNASFNHVKRHKKFPNHNVNK